MSPSFSLLRPGGAVLLLAAAFLAGCQKTPAPAAPGQPAVTPHAAARDFETPWRTETQFIVTTTLTDLVGMAYYAARGQAPDPQSLQLQVRELLPHGAEPPAYEVQIAYPGAITLKTRLEVTGSIWAPELYRPVLEQLCSQLHVEAETAAPTTAAHRVLRELTRPTAPTIERENGVVSRALAEHFRSVPQHEEAALLLAAFALREYSGIFFDIRSELCRLSAHLAMAQALRRDVRSTEEGLLATAALLALSGDQVRALRELDRLPPGNEAVAAWVRALRIRVTGDYRILNTVPNPTWLERREEFAARVKSLGASWADATLEDRAFRASTEWTHVINQEPHGVELGHRILERALSDEVLEARQVHLLATSEELPEASLCARLNAEPEACVTAADGKPVVRVVGWGHWAYYFQRHLCHEMRSDFGFIQNWWGVPERARQYRDYVDQHYNTLRLHPFVRRQNSTEANYYRKAQDDEMTEVYRHPHLVPSEAWNQICYPIPCAPLYLPPPHPHINEWHRINPLPGTAYDFVARVRHPSLTNRPDHAQVVANLHAMAPYDAFITRTDLLLQAGGPRATLTDAALEAGYGPLLEFNATLMGEVAEACKQTRPERYAYWVERAAACDPSWNYQLAAFHAAAGREAEAAAAYEKIVLHDTDAVRMSQRCDWLVQYYERTGRTREATALAGRAAEVYSSGGLETLARLLERRGDFRGAITWFRKENERYKFPGPLTACLLRYEHRTGRADYDPALRELVTRVLPDGLVQIAAADLAGPPAHGVVLCAESDETRKVDLRRTDVIVGVRGYRVGSFAAYSAVRDLEPDTPFRLHVWREGRYLEIAAAPPNNRFGVGMQDYTATPAASPR